MSYVKILFKVSFFIKELQLHVSTHKHVKQKAKFFQHLLLLRQTYPLSFPSRVLANMQGAKAPVMTNGGKPTHIFLIVFV